MNFTRKTFSVEAMQVTTENIYEIAEWCGGTIKDNGDGFVGDPQAYIEVPVAMKNGIKRDKAFYGDWVTRTERSFKAYRDEAFKIAFEQDAPVEFDPDVRHEEVYRLVHEAMGDQHKATSGEGMTYFNRRVTAVRITNKIVEIFEGEMG